MCHKSYYFTHSLLFGHFQGAKRPLLITLLAFNQIIGQLFILQVLQQWTRVSSEPSMAMTPSPSPPRNQSPIDLYPIPDVDDDYSEDYVPPSTKSRQKPRYLLNLIFHSVCVWQKQVLDVVYSLQPISFHIPLHPHLAPKSLYTCSTVSLPVFLLIYTYLYFFYRPPKEKKAKPKLLSAKPAKQSKSRIIASDSESEEDEGQ